MQEKNNTPLIILIVIVAIIAIAAGGVVSTYNGMIAAREEVDRSYADISTQLQRRSDLIPNLVQTVSGYMEHEKAVIESVTTARERMLQTGSMSELAEADSQMSQALNALLVVAENYPDLKANENFIQLQDELAGTENRIATARRDYNAVVERFNAKIQKFPGVLMANLLGYSRMDYFQAAAGAYEVPNVSF